MERVGGVFDMHRFTCDPPFCTEYGTMVGICGPCAVVLMTLAGLALVADALMSKGSEPHVLQHPRLLATFGWTYLRIEIVPHVGKVFARNANGS